MFHDAKVIGEQVENDFGRVGNDAANAAWLEDFATSRARLGLGLGAASGHH
jgi:hypothetical protein